MTYKSDAHYRALHALENFLAGETSVLDPDDAEALAASIMENVPELLWVYYNLAITAADDHEADAILDASMKAGFLWRCTEEDEDGFECKYINGNEDNICDDCGKEKKSA